MNNRERVFFALLEGRHSCDAIQSVCGLSKSQVQDALTLLRDEGVIHAVGRVRVAAGRGGPQTLWSVWLGKEGWRPRPARANAPKECRRKADEFTRRREEESVATIGKMSGLRQQVGMFAGLLS